jgi:hypothetical protein
MSLTFIYQSFTHILTYETFCKEAMIQRVAWSETKEEFKLRCETAWSKLSSFCTNGVFEFDFIPRSFNELCKQDIVYAVDDLVEELCLTVEDRDYKCIPPYMLPPLSESEHCAFADCTTCDPVHRNTLTWRMQDSPMRRLWRLVPNRRHGFLRWNLLTLFNENTQHP